jgi:hypothetical protein
MHQKQSTHGGVPIELRALAFHAALRLPNRLLSRLLMPHRLERAQHALLPRASSQHTAAQQLNQRAFQRMCHACRLRAAGRSARALRKSEQRRQQLGHKQRALPGDVARCVDEHHGGRPGKRRIQQPSDHVCGCAALGQRPAKQAP